MGSSHVCIVSLLRWCIDSTTSFDGPAFFFFIFFMKCIISCNSTGFVVFLRTGFDVYSTLVSPNIFCIVLGVSGCWGICTFVGSGILSLKNVLCILSDTFVFVVSGSVHIPFEAVRKPSIPLKFENFDSADVRNCFNLFATKCFVLFCLYILLRVRLLVLAFLFMFVCISLMRGAMFSFNISVFPIYRGCLSFTSVFFHLCSSLKSFHSFSSDLGLYWKWPGLVNMSSMVVLIAFVKISYLCSLVSVFGSCCASFFVTAVLYSSSFSVSNVIIFLRGMR